MKARTVIIVVVPLVLLLLALVGGSNLILRLFFISMLVLLISQLWTVFITRGVSVEAKKPPEHCQVGDSFQQEITVMNTSKIPKLWLRVEENTDIPGYHTPRVLNLPATSSYNYQTNVYCQRRGQYSLGSFTVTATDPFGLFSRHRNSGEPHSILIYPATFDLPLFKLSTSGDFGYRPGYQSISQISPNASSVREFTIGDSLHHIHWRSTAHTGRLMVKTFDADRSHNGAKNLWIVVDMQEACHLGQGDETTEEYGISIAASLVKKYLRSGIRVGLLASSEQTCLFTPNTGEEHLWRILEALAVMKATGKVPVDKLIIEQMAIFSNNPGIIIVTTSATGQLVDVIRHFKNRIDSVVVVLLDASSFGGDIEAKSITRSLRSMGVQVYTVRQGDELARVLDNRFSLMQARYV